MVAWVLEPNRSRRQRNQECGKMWTVAYSGKGDSDEERYAWAEEETIRRLKEWIAGRDERRRLLRARQERDVVVLDAESELTSV